MVNPNFLKTPEVASYSIRGSRPTGVDKLCYLTDTVNDNGSWEEINPLSSKLPTFIFQLAIVLFVTRLCLLLLKPLRQPHFAAELLAGILVGSTTIASEFARNHIPILGSVFAPSRIMMMETVGKLGLIYHVFLLGLEMDLRALTSVCPTALAIGIAGAIFPFGVGAFLYAFIADYPEKYKWGFLYWGVAFSVTGLPVIAEIFAKLKLLHSEIGRIAMSSALVNDFSSWVFLVCSLAVTSSYSSTYLSLFSSIAFIIFSIFVIRPTLLWMIRKTREGEEYSEATMCTILAMVLACGLVTDVCGVSSVLGAFVFGLIIPPDLLGHRFVMMLQGFASDLLMPLYYASLGMRARLEGLNKEDSLIMVIVCFFSFMPKIVCTIVVSYFCRMSMREGFTLGVLMNTKGLLAVVAMSLGRDHNVMSDDGFVIISLTIFIMTIATSPIVNFLYQRTKRFLPSQHMTLQDLRPDAELRIVTCIHEVQTVAGITNLLEISHASRRSPISVFALQLMQLKKHTSALLIVHGSSGTSLENSNRVEQIDQLIAAFKNSENKIPMLSVQLLTAISPYATMHEDVCSVAEEKQVALIILPFHKRQTIHNNMEEMNPAYRGVNNNVLATAPCTVGVLVDRGFGTLIPTTKADDCRSKSCRIAMIFIGGPDDREALAYVSRMARHPNVSVTVLRFILHENLAAAGNDDADFSLIMEREAERQADDFVVNEFRYKVQNDDSIVYAEEMSSNGAETVKIIRSLGQDFDLYVVGRGLGSFSPLKGGLDEWNDCPELGSIGDLLLTSDFSSTASILVVQRHAVVVDRLSGQGNSIL